MTRSPFTVEALRHGLRSDAVPGPYELAELPYPVDALEGFLSAELLELHHDRHHRKYVDGLNETLAALSEARREGSFEHMRELSRALAFHGSGHLLHDLYWHSMSPTGGGQPPERLRTQLERSFGTLDAFLAHLRAAALAVEGGGWALLSYEPLGSRLVVLGIESHQQMAFQGAIPLLACDVWEHAYYLSFRNRRAGYVSGFLERIDWRHVDQRLTEVLRP